MGEAELGRRELMHCKVAGGEAVEADARERRRGAAAESVHVKSQLGGGHGEETRDGGAAPSVEDVRPCVEIVERPSWRWEPTGTVVDLQDSHQAPEEGFGERETARDVVEGAQQLLRESPRPCRCADCRANAVAYLLKFGGRDGERACGRVESDAEVRDRAREVQLRWRTCRELLPRMETG